MFICVSVGCLSSRKCDCVSCSVVIRRKILLSFQLTHSRAWGHSAGCIRLQKGQQQPQICIYGFFVFISKCQTHAAVKLEAVSHPVCRRRHSVFFGGKKRVSIHVQGNLNVACISNHKPKRNTKQEAVQDVPFVLRYMSRICMVENHRLRSRNSLVWLDRSQSKLLISCGFGEPPTVKMSVWHCDFSLQKKKKKKMWWFGKKTSSHIRTSHRGLWNRKSRHKKRK